MGRVDIRLRREHRLVVVIVSARKVVRRIALTFERDFPSPPRAIFLLRNTTTTLCWSPWLPQFVSRLSRRISSSHEGLVMRFASVPLL